MVVLPLVEVEVEGVDTVVDLPVVPELVDVLVDELFVVLFVVLVVVVVAGFAVVVVTDFLVTPPADLDNELTVPLPVTLEAFTAGLLGVLPTNLPSLI